MTTITIEEHNPQKTEATTASTPREVRVSGKDTDPKPRTETSPDQGRPLNRAMRELASKQADEERAEKVNR